MRAHLDPDVPQQRGWGGGGLILGLQLVVPLVVRVVAVSRGGGGQQSLLLLELLPLHQTWIHANLTYLAFRFRFILLVFLIPGDSTVRSR